MILFGLIILVFVFLGMRQPEAKQFNKDVVTVLKPFLAMGIVLHHLHAQSVYLHEFERWGPLIVGIFFFISAYGLSYSLDNRPGYMKNFLSKKIMLKLVLPTFLAFLLNFLLNEHVVDYSFMKHLNTPGGPFFFSNDWFMYALVYCYLIFMVAAKAKNRNVQLYIQICGSLIFVLVTALNDFARNWWATPLAFPVGAFYYQNELRIRKLVNGKTGLLISTLLYLSVLGSLMAGSALFNYNVTTVLAYSLLPLLLVNCMIRLDVSSLAKNRNILFLSGISFEIYLVHGIIIDFLSKHVELSGPVLIVATIVTSLLVAVLFHKLIIACQKPFVSKFSVKTNA